MRIPWFVLLATTSLVSNVAASSVARTPQSFPIALEASASLFRGVPQGEPLIVDTFRPWGRQAPMLRPCLPTPSVAAYQDESRGARPVAATFLSVAATGAGTIIGWRMIENARGMGLFSDLPGTMVLAAGAIAGPSVGYDYAGMHRRASLGLTIRTATFLMAMQPGDTPDAKFLRGAGVALTAGSALWDIVHVGGDVERQDSGFSFGPTRMPGHESAPAWGARTSF